MFPLQANVESCDNGKWIFELKRAMPRAKNHLTVDFDNLNAAKKAWDLQQAFAAKVKDFDFGYKDSQIKVLIGGDYVPDDADITDCKNVYYYLF